LRSISRIAEGQRSRIVVEPTEAVVIERV